LNVIFIALATEGNMDIIPISKAEKASDVNTKGYREHFRWEPGQCTNQGDLNTGEHAIHYGICININLQTTDIIIQCIQIDT
jgi:hypothetical protein